MADVIDQSVGWEVGELPFDLTVTTRNQDEKPVLTGQATARVDA